MEGRDDIYVYLNSSFNKNEYSSNTADGFTNVIKPTLNLDSSYEVALDNIIFDPNIYYIRKNDEKYSVKVEICYSDDRGLPKSFAATYYPSQNFKKEELYLVIEFLNRDLITFLKKWQMIRERQKYIFRYISTSSFVHFHALGVSEIFKKKKDLTVKWNVGEQFARIMGISKLSFVEKPIINEPAKFPKKISCIYVYTDIIEPSYLGEQSVNLLDIIPMQHMQSKKGALSLFKRINKTILDDISIRLTDQDGDGIPFANDVATSIVLHFKRN